MASLARRVACLALLAIAPSCSLSTLDDLQSGAGAGAPAATTATTSQAAGGGGGGAVSSGGGGSDATTATLASTGAGGSGDGGAGGGGGSEPLSAYALAVMADEPVGWWRLGEPPGAMSAIDEVGGNHGTILPGVEEGVDGALAGDADTAFAFDGDDAVEVDDVWGFDGGQPFTVEAWVKVDADPTQAAWLVNKEHDDTNGRSGWGLLVGPDLSIGVDVWDDGVQFGAYVFTTVELGAWTHAAATFDGTTLRLYVDGEAATDTGMPSPFAAGRTLLTFGRSARGGGGLDGMLDEIAVYDRALTPARILAHVQAGAR